ncbi:MAG: hypothetical protein H2040_07805 [Euryhalocaulis sp.]|uniref:hypothetical protein n=1 Tax=Euryhalocaulis sp. TaxID=2744307 RepID=UPI00184C1C02|nr:hypothetical protein [Euryhalocaulis sp.]MBA4801754.1 hypothetical protein [Euryhalocaulis sp.]
MPTETDKSRFVELLREEAQAHGFHVDVATPDELKVFAEIPITFRAGIWRGENDEELIASAMDYKDHVGRIWISFSLGQDPDRSARFREALVPRIKKTWPDTRALPIMPSGAIPLAKDLVRTPSGYVVRSSEAEKYSGDNNN